MKKNLTIETLLAGAALFATSSAFALNFDANVTSNVIMGSGPGISNGSWTVDQNFDLGIELGLRGKTRLPFPDNTFNSNGNGTYTFVNGGPKPTDPNRPVWNFEWSINSNYNSSGSMLNSFNYQLVVDIDPTLSENLFFYNLNTFKDNQFGNNLTGPGLGVKASSSSEYSEFISTNNVVQNSWSPHWIDSTYYFTNGINTFNPNATGTYDIYLAAYDKNGKEVARTAIQVNVVPDSGSSFALLGLGIIGLGFIARRRRA